MLIFNTLKKKIGDTLSCHARMPHNFTLCAFAVAASLSLCHTVSAQTEKPNVVFIYSPVGSPSGAWLPAETDTGISLTESTAPLAPFANIANFRFLTHSIAGHDFGISSRALGAWYTETSIDQQLASIYSDNTPAIYLGIQTEINVNHAVRIDGQMVPPMSDPLQARLALLGPEGVVGNVSSLLFEMYEGHRQQIRDQVLLQNTSAIRSLDGLYDSLSGRMEFDLRIAAEQSCLEELRSLNRPQGFTPISDMQINTLVNAIKCKDINVATLQLGDSEWEWVPDNFDGPQNVTAHGLCHTGNPQDAIKLSQFISNRVADVLTALDDTRDVNGQPLLDNTVVVQVSSGGNCDSHSNNEAPFILFAGNNVQGFKRGTAKEQGDTLSFLGALGNTLGLTESDTHINLSSDTADILN